MKKLFALMLALALVLVLTACGCKHEFSAATCTAPATCTLCGETEGEPKGHSMVEANCEEAKHCENCDLVEGEPLDHTWVEATTENPQTCNVCGAKEGERIITDPRFITDATKELQGKWKFEDIVSGDAFGLSYCEGFYGSTMLELHNDGTMAMYTVYPDDWRDILKQQLIDYCYEELAEKGMDKEAVDADLMAEYGTTVDEVAENSLAAANVDMLFNFFQNIQTKGVYYVENGVAYFSTSSWDGQFNARDYTVDAETLFFHDSPDSVYVRVTE